MSKEPELGHSIRRLTIISKSLFTEDGFFWNDHLFRETFNGGLFARSLPQLSNLQELFLDQPGITTEIDVSEVFFSFTALRKLGPKRLNILGVDGSSCTLGAPATIAVTEANHIASRQDPSLTELTISGSRDPHRGMTPYIGMQGFTNIQRSSHRR